MEVRLVIRKQDNPLTTSVRSHKNSYRDHQESARSPACTGHRFFHYPWSGRAAGGLPADGEDDRRRLPFETIESEDFIFITARLPIHLISTPHVEIMQDAIHIFIDERIASIILQSPVDASRSHYTVRHGILDITLTKIRKT